jgi:hypothetical protein
MKRKNILLMLIVITVSLFSSCKSKNSKDALTCSITTSSVVFAPSSELGDRKWNLSELGIKPEALICNTDKVQHLIDSAYKLPGFTIFVIDTPGQYFFSTTTDLTHKRTDPWWGYEISTRAGSVIITSCP